MTQLIKRIEEEFYEYVKKISSFQEAINLLYWDLRTGAPKEGANHRAEVIGILSTEVYHMYTSETMAAFIAKLSNDNIVDKLPYVTKRTLEECKKEYNRNKKIPVEQYNEYVILQSKAETIWEDARKNNDFAMFAPYLEQLVEMNKQFIEYWGYEGNKYNTLLDLYEPGITVDIIDKLFTELKDAIIPLVEKISNSSKTFNNKYLTAFFPIEKQRQFSLDILKQMGYNFNAGRLDTTVHPFAIGLNPGDVRVTTRYDENDFRTAVFGSIHEGGHALYEQNISDELIGTPLCGGRSYGIHESQSLFYENFIGRNKNFWKKNYPLLKLYTNEIFKDISLNEFYEAINESKRSLIRVEADELTYCLHIIIRYEIEKSLFNDEIKVKELPEIWNDKYEKYLGIRPKNDSEGVLQDIHWAGGSFGYFPSYALGYIYAGQFHNTMQNDLPNFNDLLTTGNLLPIKQWFTERIYKFGKLKKPLQLIKEITGEGLNAKYLISYLEEKYKEIYELNE